MRSRVSIIGTRRRGNFPLADRDQNRAIPNTRPKTVTVEVSNRWKAIGRHREQSENAPNEAIFKLY
jgi:hypothetical protein